MGDHRLRKRVMPGKLESVGKRGPGGEEKEWTDCVADDLWLFGVTGDWSTTALDPGAWYNTVHEGGCRFMAAWVREEENASNQRQKKRKSEEADKVEVVPGVMPVLVPLLQDDDSKSSIRHKTLQPRPAPSRKASYKETRTTLPKKIGQARI